MAQLVCEWVSSKPGVIKWDFFSIGITRFGFALAATKPQNATTHPCNNANERSEATNRDSLRYLGHLLGMPIKSAITVGKNLLMRVLNGYSYFLTNPNDLPNPTNSESFQLLHFSSNFD